MKLLFLAVMLSFSGMAQQKFGDFTFGSSPSEYKNLDLEIDEGDTKLYSSSSKVEGLELADLNITFTKNKLSGIALRTKNAGGEKLLKTLKDTYGEPVIKSASRMEWKNAKLQIFFEKDKTGKDASASIYTLEKKKN